MKYQKTIQTQFYDLDWNRHVTSRTYEKMAYAARMEILKDLGYPISEMLQKQWKWVSQGSHVRFHSQQYENKDLLIETELVKDSHGSLHFHQKLYDIDKKPVCTIGNQSILLDESKNPIQMDAVEEDLTRIFSWKLNERLPSWNTLQHSLYIPFGDMNCFWNLPTDSVWKIFEEGRFLFFKELVDLTMVTEFDTSTFFMGGDIEIIELPEPGSTIRLHSWIDEIQKIRFYFRQDIVSQEGKLLAKMRDEQLFVSLSSSRPKKAPPEFLQAVGNYIRPTHSLLS
jgi:acyl-CoA thioesterase FadM